MPRQDADTQDPATEPEKTKEPTAREAFTALPEAADGPTQFVAGAIGNAVDLIDAKHAIQADLQQSRDFLAFAVKSGQATEDQAAWVNQYLPKRQRGASDNGTQEG